VRVLIETVEYLHKVVDRKAVEDALRMHEHGRFETDWLATDANLEALTDLSGTWIDRVHARKPPEGIILGMDSSESPTHGATSGWLRLLQPCLLRWIGAWLAFKGRRLGNPG
jgi:hypothetical protein